MLLSAKAWEQWPPLKVLEATVSLWEGHRMRSPWASPGDIPERTRVAVMTPRWPAPVAHCLLAVSPGPAMWLWCPR